MHLIKCKIFEFDRPQTLSFIMFIHFQQSSMDCESFRCLSNFGTQHNLPDLLFNEIEHSWMGVLRPNKFRVGKPLVNERNKWNYGKGTRLRNHLNRYSAYHKHLKYIVVLMFYIVYNTSQAFPFVFWSYELW